MCARLHRSGGCCVSFSDKALGVCQYKRPRHLECAESTAPDVRERDPNVTEQAGTRPAPLQGLSGPVTSPRAATRQNPLHGPRPCASGVSPHTESSVYAFSPLFVRPGHFWPPHPTFWAFFAYSRAPQHAARTKITVNRSSPRAAGHRTPQIKSILPVVAYQRTADPTF